MAVKDNNNIKNVEFKVPLNMLVVVTGVSGSGKSTMVNDSFYKIIKSKLDPLHNPLDLKKIGKVKGFEEIDKVVRISQEPIGRTPRSNPATFTSVFDDIRDIFAATAEAKIRNYTKGRFSFNVRGGRCEKCDGDGYLRVSMNFLPDVFVECDICEGKRYNEETLDIKFKDKNIHDILEMTAEEALKFFDAFPKIKQKLQYLCDVGLEYIKLGHPAPLLSGGEAQRVKLATHLQKRATGKTVYILDEPTTGLHMHDIAKLINVLNKIVDNGDSVIVIEHNLDVVKVADWIIDLGPEGGHKGGKVVAQGRPEDVIKAKNSFTALYLNETLKK